ncbi:hypothetical protein ACQKOH_20045 [Sphingomonas sp. NPDC092331]|jgi:hypothetical protein|uniref:hypothetical protein n=1 Tax=unclassified Sphingomonas TaxID=196159 RepID=UPI0031F56241
MILTTALALGMAAQGRCATLDTRLPRSLAGWTRDGRGLDTGHAVTLPVRGGSGVETRVTIRKAGTVGIAIDRAGWIDAFAAGSPRALRMASERRGPRCSTIHKILYYRMRPGTYRVTVNRLKGGRARLMLTHD